MTILDLQESLAKDVERTLKDVATTDAAGEKVSGVTAHTQEHAGGQGQTIRWGARRFRA